MADQYLQRSVRIEPSNTVEAMRYEGDVLPLQAWYPGHVIAVVSDYGTEEVYVNTTTGFEQIELGQYLVRGAKGLSCVDPGNFAAAYKAVH